MKHQEESIRGKAQEFVEKAKEMEANAGEKAKDFAANVADKARDLAGNVLEKTKETASALGQRADDATHAVAKGMENLAGTVRQNAPEGGIFGTAASTVAKGLETGGQYLEREGLSGISDDLVNLIKRNPIPAVLIGIGLGFCLARLTVSNRN
jgi:ElaB/YqjD/DUF883 family membrane-anchored ribosome-binding protein